MGMSHYRAKEFQVLGQKIVMQTQAEADLALKAIELVEKKVAALAERTENLSPHQVAVLALLEMAGDLIKDRAAMDQYRHELDMRCTTLLTTLADQTESRAI